MSDKELNILIREMENELKNAINDSNKRVEELLPTYKVSTKIDLHSYDHKLRFLDGRIDGITKMINLLEKKKSKNLSLSPEE